MAPYRKVQTRIWNDQKFALLAKSEDVSLLALSQLARPRDGDINSRPSLLQLKESGDIEASAHNVSLIFMPYYHERSRGWGLVTKRDNNVTRRLLRL